MPADDEPAAPAPPAPPEPDKHQEPGAKPPRAERTARALLRRQLMSGSTIIRK